MSPVQLLHQLENIKRQATSDRLAFFYYYFFYKGDKYFNSLTFFSAAKNKPINSCL